MSKLRLAFVDDEPNILSGLKRMLRVFRKEWEMHFFEGGAEALAAMEESPFDVLISDMRMPGINGAELLKLVHEKYPATIRIILSGHCDQDLILQSVGFAHQYLSKPSSPEKVQMVVNKSMQLRKLLHNAKLQEKVSTIQALPTPPAIYQELIGEINSEEPSIKAVADIISRDVGITTKLLQILNSAFFGLPTEVASPLHAVNLLGLDTIQSLVLTTGVFNLLDIEPIGTMTTSWHTSHGIRVGRLAKEITKRLGFDQKASRNAMLAGMLHDVGILVELAYFRTQFEAAYNESVSRGISIQEAERSYFGVDHGEIGAYLLGIWGLPDPIIEAIGLHHDPSRSLDCAGSELLAVHLAEALVEAEEAGDPETWLERVDSKVVEELELESKLESLIELIQVEA